MKKKVKDSALFGEPLRYNKIFFGVTDDKGDVTVEEFVGGNFVKYINNNGLLTVPVDDEVGQKAQCFAHFTYEKSNRKMMVLDIQGSGHMLYDPEIATSDLFDEGNEMLFCTGNLSSLVITNFIDNHKCNHYCECSGLTELYKS